MAFESAIEVMFFLLVAGVAQGLQVADVVGSSGGNGDDMVDVEFCFSLGLTAALTLVFVAVKYIFSDFWRDGDSWGFRHFF
jgi:hypothetical protein